MIWKVLTDGRRGLSGFSNLSGWHLLPDAYQLTKFCGELDCVWQTPLAISWRACKHRYVFGLGLWRMKNKYWLSDANYMAEKHSIPEAVNVSMFNKWEMLTVKDSQE